MVKCDFCPGEAFAVVKTTLGVGVEKEHNVCKNCYKQMEGWKVVRKL